MTFSIAFLSLNVLNISIAENSSADVTRRDLLRRKFQLIVRLVCKFSAKLFCNLRRTSKNLFVWCILTNAKLEKYPEISSQNSLISVKIQIVKKRWPHSKNNLKKKIQTFFIRWFTPNNYGQKGSFKMILTMNYHLGGKHCKNKYLLHRWAFCFTFIIGDFITICMED